MRLSTNSPVEQEAAVEEMASEPSVAVRMAGEAAWAVEDSAAGGHSACHSLRNLCRGCSRYREHRFRRRRKSHLSPTRGCQRMRLSTNSQVEEAVAVVEMALEPSVAGKRVGDSAGKGHSACRNLHNPCRGCSRYTEHRFRRHRKSRLNRMQCCQRMRLSIGSPAEEAAAVEEMA